MIDSRVPLYIKTKEHIIELIDNGGYKPGSRLPSEKEIMQLLGVGRATVRSALAELEKEEKVLKRHGVGTFVAEPKKSYSFEPLISLTYSLKRMGIELKNKTLLSETVVSEGELTKGWQNGTVLGHIKRLRMSGSTPAAVEDSYFVPELFDLVKAAGSAQSFSHLIAEKSSEELGRVSMEILVRKPTDEERYILELDENEKVAHMKRWIYSEDKRTPVNYVNFVVSYKLLN
ncbi:MAG TPA: GntR family transcriptional regulator [Clostridia bacterium]|nr:GntR family transcriptional regulator [Clostridia bacterium]